MQLARPVGPPRRCRLRQKHVPNARVEGVRRVDADHENGTVKITADEGTEDDVRQAIHDAGYDVPA